jgi:hypothetical protein
LRRQPSIDSKSTNRCSRLLTCIKRICNPYTRLGKRVAISRVLLSRELQELSISKYTAYGYTLKVTAHTHVVVTIRRYMNDSILTHLIVYSYIGYVTVM